MKFSNYLKYSRGLSNTEWEGLTKRAVTIILNQFLYWWSSARVTQHSHLTVSTCAFYPHHAMGAFDSSDSIRSDTGKSWRVGGEWVSNQAQSRPHLALSWAQSRPDTHVAMNTQIRVNCEKNGRTIPLDSHIITVWSTPFLYASSKAYQVFH